MAHPKICRSYYRRELCPRNRCDYVHPIIEGEMNQKSEHKDQYWQRDRRMEENAYKHKDSRNRHNFLEEKERDQYRRDRPIPTRTRTDTFQLIEMLLREKEREHRIGRRGSHASYFA